MNIGIIGAGPGAFAMAGHVAGMGYPVGICELPRFKKNIDLLRQTRTVKCTGMISGCFQLEMVTSDVGEITHWSDILIVVTHAAAHRDIARLAAGFLTKEKRVILCPGYVGGAVRFKDLVRTYRHDCRAVVEECSVLPFACRKPAADTVSVHGIKRQMLISRSPDNTGVDQIKQLFPNAVFTDHPLEAGLHETNFIIHACICRENYERVSQGRPWTFYRQGLTDAAGDLIEQVEQERQALLVKMGLTPISLRTWFRAFYGDQGMRGKTVTEQLSTFKPFESSPGPVSPDHRYFTEDISFGLVPMSGLAGQLNVPVPKTDQLIKDAEKFCRTDFRACGGDLTGIEPGMAVTEKATQISV